MALFTDTRELERQGRHRNFRKVTGGKKVALSLLGYKDDGTKNLFGKTLGLGNPLLDHYVPKWIAGKDSDTGKVIDSAESDEWAKFGATAKFAMNFVGGGAGNQLLGKMGMGQAGGALGGAAGGDAMSGLGEKAAKKASMDALNSGYSEQTTGGKTVTSIGGVDLDEDSLAKYNKFMEENPDGTMEEFQATQGTQGIDDGQSKVGQGLLDVARSTEAIPVLGDLMGAIGARVPINRTLNSKKAEIENQSSTQNFNYL